MRSILSTAALLSVVSAYEISDYIQAAANTPSGPSSTFGKSATSSSSGEPCGQIADLQAQRNSTYLPADLALACLQSVPLDAEGGAVQLDGLKAFLQFQSTLAYLKDPPPGYLYPATDIIGGLDQIGELLSNKSYSNEYDFQLDIYKLIASAYDGHFQYEADILSVFFFTRDLALYSVSTDGTSLPEIYTAEDVGKILTSKGSNSTVSPVTKINGVDVETWLNEYATLNGNSQDPDANYNTLFPNAPMNAQTVAQGGEADDGQIAFSIFYQGNDTTVTLKNGVTRHVKTGVTTRKKLKGVTDGKSFFDKFCNGAPQSNSTTGGAPPTSTQVSYKPVPTETEFPAPDGYPQPLVIASDYSIGGYFPKQNPDLAVLSVPTFEPADPVEFQDVVREFLATSKKEGKKNLVIDLRGNGGGDVLLGFDMFKQLFPDMDPYGGTNFRAHSLFNDVGKIVSDYYSNVTEANATLGNIETEDYTSVFNVKMDLNGDDGAFKSWSDFFGPHEYHNDNFTSITRYNLSDILDTGGIFVSGYGPLADVVPEQTFKAENIILVQDGYCASTCTVFAEFMKNQAHVKQVVFGGRKQESAMQGVGGVKGANIYTFDIIAAFIDEAFADYATDEQQTQLATSYPKLLAGAKQALKRAAVGSSGIRASVNVRNNIRKGDDTVTPLQFVYEAADCRLFYTADQVVNQALVWDAAAKAAWGNGSCVKGSTGQVSSGIKAPEDAKPPKDASNLFGANDTHVYPSDLKPAVTPTSTSSSTPSSTGKVSNTSESAKPNAGAVVTSSGFAAVIGVAASLLLL